MSWSERSRHAAVALSSGAEREDDSITALLLRDIHAVFGANGHDRLKTADLLAELYKIEESPWADWYGKQLSPNGLSRLLKPYRIKTMPVWSDGETVRGYKAEQFADAFARALGVRSVRSVRSGLAPSATPNAPNAPNASGREERIPPIPGDPGYLEFITGAGKSGLITIDEFHEQERLHAFVAGAA